MGLSDPRWGLSQLASPAPSGPLRALWLGAPSLLVLTVGSSLFVDRRFLLCVGPQEQACNLLLLLAFSRPGEGKLRIFKVKLRSEVAFVGPVLVLPA